MPALMAEEGGVLLCYYASEPDPEWDGTYVNVVDPDTGGMAIVIVRFIWPSSHMFGMPNDEAFAGHPLASRGLRPYSVCEVLDSSWARKLERMNSVHPRHDPSRFENDRHFIFVFHDSVFECVADGFEITIIRGSMRSAMKRMVKMLGNDGE